MDKKTIKTIAIITAIVCTIGITTFFVYKAFKKDDIANHLEEMVSLEKEESKKVEKKKSTSKETKKAKKSNKEKISNEGDDNI